MGYFVSQSCKCKTCTGFYLYMTESSIPRFCVGGLLEILDFGYCWQTDKKQEILFKYEAELQGPVYLHLCQLFN